MISQRYWSDRDFYGELNLSSGATPDEINKAYRALAKQLHPDVRPNDAQAEAEFKRVTEAYEVLSNSEARSDYDFLRSLPFPETAFEFIDFRSSTAAPEHHRPIDFMRFITVGLLLRVAISVLLATGAITLIIHFGEAAKHQADHDLRSKQVSATQIEFDVVSASPNIVSDAHCSTQPFEFESTQSIDCRLTLQNGGRATQTVYWTTGTVTLGAINRLSDSNSVNNE